MQEYLEFRAGNVCLSACQESIYFFNLPLIIFLIKHRIPSYCGARERSVWWTNLAMVGLPQ